MSPSSRSIILLHGAFSDASIWNNISSDLQARGFRVLCPALPMRSLAADAAHLNAILEHLDGPVVLVGHSYAGSVISYPTQQYTKISALVYVAAFQPDRTESAGELNARFPGSKLLPETLNIWETPTGLEIHLKPEHFKEVYAADLTSDAIKVMSAAQRPVAAVCLSESFAADPLWKTIPSWAIVAKQDQSIPPQTLRFMASRAMSQIIELDASHAAPASRPAEIVQAILAAAGSVKHAAA